MARGEDRGEEEREERPHDRAGAVHRPLEPEGAAVGLLGRRLGEEDVAHRRPRSTPHPPERAAQQDVPGLRREGEARHARGGHEVADDGERLPASQAIGVVAGRQLREAGEAIGDAFDEAEHRRARADRGEERRHRAGGHLVANVREQARQADSEHRSVEPSRLAHVSTMASTSVRRLSRRSSSRSTASAPAAIVSVARASERSAVATTLWRWLRRSA